MAACSDADLEDESELRCVDCLVNTGLGCFEPEDWNWLPDHGEFQTGVVVAEKGSGDAPYHESAGVETGGLPNSTEGLSDHVEAV